MKKLNLDLDSLTVVTFDAGPAAEYERGTVFAHVSHAADGCIESGPCPPMSTGYWTTEPTCLITCGYTCDDRTCVGSCDYSCGCTQQQTACYDSCCSDPC